jgi:hypothetical protein
VVRENPDTWLAKTCAICLHSREAHNRVKKDSLTGCGSSGCSCQSFVAPKALRGDAVPDVKK